VLVCAVLICKVCKSDRVFVLLQLRYGDSSRSKKKGNVRPWKPASPDRVTVKSSLCVVKVCKL
jgi:hypothetical protein